MEIITPQILWKDFDVSATPLDANVVSENDGENYRVKNIYYTSIKVGDGMIRTFAKLFMPKKGSGFPAVVRLDDAGVPMGDVSSLVDLGYAVLLVDYSGAGDGLCKTLYPKSLQFLNYNKEQPDTGDPRRTKCYYYIIEALRAAEYLRHDKDILPDKIVAVGIGEGAGLVCRMNIFGGIKAGVTFFGLPPRTEEFIDKKLSLNACLDPRLYLKVGKFPILEIITTNEDNDTFDDMVDLMATMTNTESRLAIAERANKFLEFKHYEDMVRWLDCAFCDKSYMPMPKLIGYQIEGTLVYEIKTESAPEEVTLFTAYTTGRSSMRNWTAHKVSLVDGKLMATVEVNETGDIIAFANVTCDGVMLSTNVITRSPSKLGINVVKKMASRLIYDTDMKLDDWLVMGQGNFTDYGNKLMLAKGPYGLEGITALTNDIATFKLSSPRFRGKSGYSLLVSMSSVERQRVTFIVRTSDDKKYTTSVEITPQQEWRETRIGVNSFKGSPFGTLGGWENVVSLEIKSESQLLIASLLWV